jgi:glycosyltransferase involved in cell wall biosynthesis
MKKLLQINPVLRTNTSTGRIVQEIGELAIKEGWDSYVAYSGGRDGLKPCKSKLIPVGGKVDVAFHGLWTRLTDRHGLASWSATRRFIDEIKALKPDIIHIHNIHGYFLNYKILFDFLAQSDIPVVWTVHDCWLYTGHCYHYAAAGCYKWQSLCEDCPQKFEFPASYLVDRSRQNYLDKKEAFTSVPNMTIVTVSEWMKNEMSNSFLKNCQFQVIHNGIDLNVFSVQDNEQGVRQRYGLGDKRIILGLASIWSKEKGWDDFIEMAKMLNDNELIVLVGVSEKQQEQLPSNIVGIRRTENVQQLAELYSAADVFVNPTWQDNYPTVNLEAIACGTPVVTYRTGGSVEAITDSTGMIVEQGDVAGLLSAAREIMQRGTQFFKDSCRKFAFENFDKEERYNDYLKLYDKLLKRSR